LLLRRLIARVGRAALSRQREKKVRAPPLGERGEETRDSSIRAKSHDVTLPRTAHAYASRRATEERERDREGANDSPTRRRRRLVANLVTDPDNGGEFSQRRMRAMIRETLLTAPLKGDSSLISSVFIEGSLIASSVASNLRRIRGRLARRVTTCRHVSTSHNSQQIRSREKDYASVGDAAGMSYHQVGTRVSNLRARTIHLESTPSRSSEIVSLAPKSLDSRCSFFLDASPRLAAVRRADVYSAIQRRIIDARSGSARAVLESVQERTRAG